MQDLTTAKENDYGFEEFSEGKVSYVNKKKFTMFYSYEIRAGVDLSKAKLRLITKPTRFPSHCRKRSCNRCQSILIL